MAIVIGGVAVGVWELGALAAAGVTALFLASPPGQEATRQAARATADALEKLRPQPDPKPDPPPRPLPPPLLPPVCEECDKKKPCSQCVPPVGTTAYEVHRVPPHDVHRPCLADHVHFFLRQQNPNNCQCFWKRNSRPVQCLSSGAVFVPPPGVVPL